VRNWLIVVAGMIFFIDRARLLSRDMTESGLSMSSGSRDRLAAAIRRAGVAGESAKYLSSPQGDWSIVFRMSAIQQKSLLARVPAQLWGRLIGTGRRLPLIWFWLSGRLSPR